MQPSLCIFTETEYRNWSLSGCDELYMAENMLKCNFKGGAGCVAVDTEQLCLCTLPRLGLTLRCTIALHGFTQSEQWLQLLLAYTTNVTGNSKLGVSEVMVVYLVCIYMVL